MNSHFDIKKFTEFILNSIQVKLITDVQGLIHKVYTQESRKSGFIQVTSFVGKSLTDAFHLDLVKNVLEMLQKVNESKQPNSDIFHFSSKDKLIKIECEVFPFTDQKFFITLKSHYTEIEDENTVDSGLSLRSSEDQFFNIISRVPIPVLLIDELSLEIFFSNYAAIDYFEYENDELYKQNLLDLFPPSENHYLLFAIRKEGVIGLEANYSWRLITKNGVDKTARFLIQQIDYEDRKTIMVIILDKEGDSKLTYIKEDEKIIDYFEQEFLMVRLTPAGIITKVNQKFSDMIGKPLYKIIGRSVEEHLFLEDYAGVLHHIKQLSPQNPVQKNTNRMLTSDGKTVWVEWTDRGVFEGDQLVEINAYGKNITDTYQRDLLQQSMEQRFQALVENLPMVTYVIHAQTMYPLYISPQVEMFTGYTQEEFYRNPEVWLNAMHPDDAEKFFSNLQDRIEQKITGPVEFRMYHKDGSLRWAEEIGSTITLPDGTLLFQGISRDVTARNKAREKLIYYSNFERLINEFSLKLMNATSKNLSEIIKFIVDELGKFMHVDRAYIFDINYQNNTLSNTYEWCKDGISSQMKELQNISLLTVPWLMDRINNNQDIVIEKVSEMPEEAFAEKDSFTAQEINSLLVVPLIYANKAQGLIGFDMVKEQIFWEQESINLLRLVGTLIISAINRIANQSNS